MKLLLEILVKVKSVKVFAQVEEKRKRRNKPSKIDAELG